MKDIGKGKTVSVGSGNKAFEKLLERKGVDIIGIDPIDKKFYKTGKKWTKLLECKNVLIIAPLSNEEGRYADEAIKLFKPNKIMLLVNIEGGSGSEDLYYPIRDAMDSSDKIVDYGKNGKYKVMTLTDKKVYIKQPVNNNNNYEDFLKII